MVINNISSEGYVLVIDSGNGGKYTLKKIQRLMPLENYIYVEDDKNCPYGSKNRQKLKKISKKLIKTLLSIYPIKLVVLACNTLSSACYDYLKSKFIGIKIIPTLPVFKDFKKNTLIMCTNATKKYNGNLTRYKNNSKVFVEGFSCLAKQIDENFENLDVLQPILDKKLKKYVQMHINNVVLGCTHFNYIKTQIAKSLIKNPEEKYVKLSKCATNKLLKTSDGNACQTVILTKKTRQLNFYEPSLLVAKQVKEFLTQNKLVCSNKYPTAVIYLKTSEMPFLAL